MTLHIQDDVSIVRKTGNLFLTNIHRAYAEMIPPHLSTTTISKIIFSVYAPREATNESKVDLGLIVREIDELVVINDEAHHIHDSRLEWFKSIQDIHNRLKQKDHFLSLQLDVTATPKHNNGAIFVQTVCDYPLVEAIIQNVVKHPVLPDFASRAKLIEKQSSKFTENTAITFTWRGRMAQGIPPNTKTRQESRFIRDDRRYKNCDDVAEYLEHTYPELKDTVLVIHTNNNGEISNRVQRKARKNWKNSVSSPTKLTHGTVRIKLSFLY